MHVGHISDQNKHWFSYDLGHYSAVAKSIKGHWRVLALKALLRVIEQTSVSASIE